MEIRRASPELSEGLEGLLAACELPALRKAIPRANVLVALDGEMLAGVMALEVAGRRGLMQSAAVVPSERRRGIGRSLVKALLARANELGLRDVYVITETAAPFFAAQGFVPVSRESVPREIQATREFSEQCSADAEVMCLPLETRL